MPAIKFTVINQGLMNK